MPNAAATCVLACGIGASSVQVATITVSTWSGVMPASAMALAAAAAPMLATVSSGAANRRSAMPTRLWIHWSLVSMTWARSSLVTTRSGR